MASCNCGTEVSRVCHLCGLNLCAWHSAQMPVIRIGQIALVTVCSPSCDFHKMPANAIARPKEWRPS